MNHANRNDAASRLAEAHYAIEPGIEHIIRVVAEPQRENQPGEPIKLLEVNANTTSDGIRPVFFGPHAASGIFYPSVIIEVTPEEYSRIRSNELPLPNNWMLGEEFQRTAQVAQ